MLKNHAIFLKTFLFSLVPSLLLIAALNVLVDPLDILHPFQLPRFNAVKIMVHDHMRTYKAYKVLKKKPAAIFLGSSRVMAGLNPADLEAITGEDCYNCGLAGVNFEDIYEYFLHALYAQPNLKTVVLGLDSFGFNTHKGPREKLPKILQGKESVFLSYFPFIFSYKALECSFRTIFANFFEKPNSFFLPNGLVDPALAVDDKTNPLLGKELDYIKDIHQNGMYKTFKVDEKALDMFTSLVSICRERNINLKVFINPPQALYWEALFQHGYWESLEELKRKLANIHPLWDFGGFNIVTTKDPVLEEFGSLYYECSHFRPLLGKVILDTLFGRNQSSVQFGHLLLPNTIEDKLAMMRKERDKWAEAHPDMVSELEKDLKKETHLVAQ
ncbi:MAG: hypothetical protein ACSNEK_04355 [Parachlamydiaceae bacterium]